MYCSVLSLSKKEKDGWKRDSRTVKSYKIFIHREPSVDVSCHDRWILPGQSRVNRVTSFDAFRLPTKRNSSNSEVVSPNFASNLCFQTEFEQVEYSNDVPPHTLIHTLVIEGRIYRSSALFGRRKRKGWQLERILKLSSSRRVQTRIGGTNILEASSHVRVMKEKRKREIRRFYFFFLGEKEELRNRAEEEKKDSSGNLLSRVVSSEIESRALFCENEKKEERKRN